VSIEAAEALLARALAERGKWPLKTERPLLDRLNTWAAVLDGDEAQLRRIHAWNDTRRAYRVDPLGERIADTWAHYLFGEDARFAPAAEADLNNLNSVVENNSLDSERRGDVCRRGRDLAAHLRRPARLLDAAH
jgi:hypothetical protein